MKVWTQILSGAAFCVAPFAWAEVPPAAYQADVVIIGELHDNPTHHRKQTEILRSLRPSTVVYEMLTPDEAAILADVARKPEEMGHATAGFHWSNIGDYSELLAVSPKIVGAALPTDRVRAAFSDGAASEFGMGADVFGLKDALSEQEQSARETLQFAAHCEAMPQEMMGGMVEAQRLRDAHFARVALDALQEYGSPIVLITGNGHARTDWGVPSVIAKVSPDVAVFSIGQSENETLQGTFDMVLDAPAPKRGDPCAAFQ